MKRSFEGTRQRPPCVTKPWLQSRLPPKRRVGNHLSHPPARREKSPTARQAAAKEIAVPLPNLANRRIPLADPALMEDIAMGQLERKQATHPPTQKSGHAPGITAG